MGLFFGESLIGQGRYVYEMPNGTYRPIMGSLIARRHWELAKSDIGKTFLLSLLFFLFSPTFFLVYLSYVFIRYYKRVYDVFFFNKEIEAKYSQMLRPVTNRKMFMRIGYRVYPEELENHLRIVTSDDDKEKEELAKRGKAMSNIPYRQFGMNVDIATRHVALISTTGGGKTETIMSMLVDAVKNFSGVGFVDGKSDQEMEYKIYNLCKQEYYETQFYAIVLNKPELESESNTFSQLLAYESAAKASEFIGEFLEAGGEGNADYFAKRSKVMLGNFVMYFKNRQFYYNENFSIGDLEGSTKITEINAIYFMAYSIIMELEYLISKKIKTDPSFKRLMGMAKISKTVQNDEIANCEVLAAYINQNPNKQREAERALGIKYRFFSDHFELFTSIDAYVHGITPTWGKYARAVGRTLFFVAKAQKKHFLYTSKTSAKITYIRSIYNKVKIDSPEKLLVEGFSSYTEEDLDNLGIPQSIVYTSASKEDFEAAMGIVQANETIENLNNDAILQHNYAVQGWDRVFGLFKQYNRIFGTSYPDVDGEDIVKNNKVLYIMLPVLELATDQVEMLGKMFILMFKGIAAIGLGGDRQSATPIQFRIYQNKIKPNPIFIMIYDELGSYIPAQGLMSQLISQVRSLRISMVLAVQDQVSLNASANPDELKRILANVAKIILQHKDVDLKGIEDLISDIKVISAKNAMRSATSGHRILDTGSIEVETRKPINLSDATKFAKGMGLYIDKARDEPVLFQSYYLGDNAKQALQIRRFEHVNNLGIGKIAA